MCTYGKSQVRASKEDKGNQRVQPHNNQTAVQSEDGLQPITNLQREALPLTPTTIARLQRTIGNKAVQRLLNIEQKSAAQTNLSFVNADKIQRDACYLPKQQTPYKNLGQTGAVGPGENFDVNQRYSILAANFQGQNAALTLTHAVDTQQDDDSGADLIDPKDLSQDIAHVDHIVPADAGGCNDRHNAQVLSEAQNTSKGNTYPWGRFSKYGVYDPASGQIFSSLRAARTGGADLTTIDSRYPYPPG